jgi:hypothetical protein
MKRKIIKVILLLIFPIWLVPLMLIGCVKWIWEIVSEFVDKLPD